MHECIFELQPMHAYQMGYNMKNQIGDVDP